MEALNFPTAVGAAPQDDRFAGLLRSIPKGSFRTAHDHLVSKHAAGLQEASLKNIAAALSRLGRVLDGLGTSLAGARPDQTGVGWSEADEVEFSPEWRGKIICAGPRFGRSPSCR